MVGIGRSGPVVDRSGGAAGPGQRGPASELSPAAGGVLGGREQYYGCHLLAVNGEHCLGWGASPGRDELLVIIAEVRTPALLA